MNALVILIPLSLLLVVTSVTIFFWAVRHDQFSDMDTPEILPMLDADQVAVHDPFHPTKEKST